MANNPLGLFSNVPANNVEYSKFDKSFVSRTSLPSGVLVPTLVLETTPGEKMRINQNHFTYLNTLVHPMFADMDMNFYYFSVPKRIIDDYFEQWYTRGPKGTIVLDKPKLSIMGLCNVDDFESPDNITFTMEDLLTGTVGNITASLPSVYLPNYWSSGSPGIAKSALSPGLLLDYLGYPVVTGVGTTYDSRIVNYDKFIIQATDIGPGSIPVDMYRWFAYWLIYDEYFRNQRLSEPILRDSNTGVRIHIRDFILDGDQNSETMDVTLLFSKFAQAGVNPFGFAPCYYDNDYFTSALPSPTLGEEVHIPFQLGVNIGGSDYSLYASHSGTGNTLVHSYNSDLSSLGAVNGEFFNSATIRDLKTAYALQRWQDISARFNNRYDDVLYGHFGVRTSDASLQRPQYLGGGSIPVRMSQVVNTASSTYSPLGERAGIASAVGNIPEITVYTEEPSIIIGLCGIRPKQVYYQGLDKLLTIFDSQDEYSPEFQHIGMEEVKSSEVSLYTSDAFSTPIFGYQSRYARYKFEPDNLRGLMRNEYLDWTTARDISSLMDNPTLSPEFQFVNPYDVNRGFAVTESNNTASPVWHNFLMESSYKIDDLQKMDFYSRTY